jgi:IS5 family transposase
VALRLHSDALGLTRAARLVAFDGTPAIRRRGGPSRPGRPDREPHSPASQRDDEGRREHQRAADDVAETWEAINRILLASARQEKVETGKVVRLDSTVTDALMHEPSDSSLLWDAVRVMVRLLKAADALVGALVWRSHRRAAKKRAGAIKYARDRPTRVQHYRELIKLAQATLAYTDQAATLLWQASDPMAAALWQAEFRHYRPLIDRIVAQTERRVLRGEAIAANEKVVSLFEPHADIIVKGGREVQYGHKLNLTTGRSGLILDLVIEAGNPADSDRFLPMLNRHIDFYGQAPRQAAADGGYASRHNLGQAKALGVRDLAFHKKAGLRVEDMVKSNWVYRKLRAGIESDISCLKRAYGLARCIWRGLDHFRAYVWSSVVAYNLALFARLKPG